MYLSAVHIESETQALHQFIRENPLGILTTAIKSPNYPLLQSSHIPWVLDVEEGKPDKLRGHLARANPQAKVFVETLKEASPATNHLEEDVMLIFNGPVHHYVAPKFYAETKPISGKVVPTWNYSAIQVYGKARIFFDTKAPETSQFLSKQINDLSNHAETSIMDHGTAEQPEAWTVAEAPVNYIELLKKAIMGIEIEVKSIGGKHKMSQEMGLGDRQGVVEGFRSLKTELGDKMADIIQTKSEAVEMCKRVKAAA